MDLPLFCKAGLSFLTTLGCFESPVPEPTPSPTNVPMKFLGSLTNVKPSTAWSDGLKILFHDNFEDSIFVPETYDKGQLSHWQRLRTCYPSKSVDFPKTDNNRHIKLTLWPKYDTSCDDFFKSPRTEASTPIASDGNQIHLLKDKKYFINFEVMVPRSWKTIEAKTIIFQIHYGSWNRHDIGPGAKIHIKNVNGIDTFDIEFATKKLICSGDSCEKQTIIRKNWQLDAIQKNQWNRFTIVYSQKENDGLFQIFLGDNKVAEFIGVTWNEYQGSSGPRMGVYSSRWLTDDPNVSHSIFVDNYTIAEQ